MRRLLVTLVTLGTLCGVASADRWHGRGRGHHHHQTQRVVVRDHRYVQQPRRVVVQRRPVYVNNGRYYFHDNSYRVYRQPVIRQRYYDYQYRPQIIAENYDNVSGYIWISGNWNWNGYEWIWVAGHYEADPNYYDASYDNGGYYHDCD
jgi:hypothetical protein